MPKKRGRPPLFDDLHRAEFCAMIESGCTIRYACQRLRIHRHSVQYACRTDPEFADRLRRAEHKRDLTAVERIQNAGAHSWRAAWLLERNAPEHFSFRSQNRDPWKNLGKRRLKQLVADVLFEFLSDARENPSASPAVKLGQRLVEDRLRQLNGELPDDDDHDPAAICDRILRDIDAQLRHSNRDDSDD